VKIRVIRGQKNLAPICAIRGQKKIAEIIVIHAISEWRTLQTPLKKHKRLSK
jgi:hypothetical protein